MAIPRHWRLKAQRYALVGTHCPGCQSVHFPPREVCPVCSSHAQAPTMLALLEGAYSFNALCLILPAGQDRAPALVEGNMR